MSSNFNTTWQRDRQSNATRNFAIWNVLELLNCTLLSERRSIVLYMTYKHFLICSHQESNLRPPVCEAFKTPIHMVLHKFLGWHISGVAKCNQTFPLKSLSFFSITVFRMFWRTNVICVVYSDLKIRQHFRAIIFTTFDMDYHDNSAFMNLNLCLAIKHHPILQWKTALMNSNVADAHSKTRSAKAVQK